MLADGQHATARPVPQRSQRQPVRTPVGGAWLGVAGVPDDFERVAVPVLAVGP